MQDELLIRNLTRDLEPALPLESSQKPLLLWLVLTFGVCLAGVVIHKLRPDVGGMLQKSSYYLELFSALSVGIVAAGGALNLRIPGAKPPVKTLAGLGALWLLSLIFHSISQGQGLAGFHGPSEYSCMASVVAFGFFPGVLLFFQIRRGASTEPRMTLALTAMGVTATAAAFLPLACANDGLVHLLVGHVSPLFLMAILCWKAGQRLLSW